MTEAPEAVILIDHFAVNLGDEAAFLALWDRTNAILRKAPGDVSARLCRALDGQPPGLRAPFTHVMSRGGRAPRTTPRRCATHGSLVSPRTTAGWAPFTRPSTRSCERSDAPKGGEWAIE
jgi:hypothetical protein